MSWRREQPGCVDTPALDCWLAENVASSPFPMPASVKLQMALFWNFAARLQIVGAAMALLTHSVSLGSKPQVLGGAAAVSDTAERAHQPFVLRLLIETVRTVSLSSSFYCKPDNSSALDGEWQQICLSLGDQ